MKASGLVFSLITLDQTNACKFVWSDLRSQLMIPLYRITRTIRDNVCWSVPYLTVNPHASLNYSHWGRVTHICVRKLTIVGPDNDLSPDRCQAIIWTNAWILLIRTLETNFSETLTEIHTCAFKNMYSNMSSGIRRKICGINVLKRTQFMLEFSYLDTFQALFRFSHEVVG